MLFIFIDSLKRDLSFESQNEINSTAKKAISHSSTQIADSNYSSLPSSNVNSYSSKIQCFLNHLPLWGGKIELESDHSMFTQYAKHSISNSCSIDYLLLCLWTSYYLNKDFLQLLNSFQIKASLTECINKVISLIDVNKWNAAKSIWIIDVCKLTPSRRVFDCKDTEYDKVARYLNNYQEFELKCINQKCDLFDIVVENRNELYFVRDDNNNIHFSLNDEYKCRNCSSIQLKHFNRLPPWLIITVNYRTLNDFICFDELLKTIDINKKKYTLLCSTIVSLTVKQHFCAIFEIDNKKLLIDDLNSTHTDQIPNMHRTSTCFYLEIN
jgi:hypothetical protein